MIVCLSIHSVHSMYDAKVYKCSAPHFKQYSQDSVYVSKKTIVNPDGTEHSRFFVLYNNVGYDGDYNALQSSHLYADLKALYKKQNRNIKAKKM